MTSEKVFLGELLKLINTGQANKVAMAVQSRIDALRAKKDDGVVTTQGGGIPPAPPPKPPGG